MPVCPVSGPPDSEGDDSDDRVKLGVDLMFPYAVTHSNHAEKCIISETLRKPILLKYKFFDNFNTDL